MASLWLPNRFIVPSVDRFTEGLKAVSAWHWHLHRLGEHRSESDRYMSAVGSMEAMHWIAGLTPIPPAYTGMLSRTRSNLMQLARFAYMVIDGEGEQVDHEDGAAQIIERAKWAGAGSVYRWALGMTRSIPGDDMLPEDVRAAQRYFASVQANDRRAA